MYKNQWKSITIKQVNEDQFKFMRIDENKLKWTKMNANVLRLIKVHENQLSSIQISDKWKWMKNNSNHENEWKLMINN